MSADVPQERTPLPGRRWIEVAVVAGCVLLILAILLPAVQRAQDAARRTQSKNNLKQFGLAFHNYHDVYSRFPIGGDIDDQGYAKHGWVMRIIPYMESSPVYSWIHHDFGWEHPVNYWVFQRDLNFTRIPDVPIQMTTDGLGLIHYLPNPNVFHRNSAVSMSDMTTGTANNWLLGEVVGNYLPWGYPFVWREMKLPFNAGEHSFGRPTGEGVQICRADGSVSLLTNDVDSAIVEALVLAPPIATRDQTAVPFRKFELQSEPGETVWENLGQGLSGEDSGLVLTVHLNSNGLPNFAQFRCPGKGEGECRDVSANDVRHVAEEYPGLRILVARRWSIEDADAVVLSAFTELQTLYVADVSVTEAGLNALRQLPKLKSLIITASSQQRQALELALPHCEIHVLLSK